MAAEARIAARSGSMVRAGGGTPAGAGVATTRLIGDGATALVSFGLAGGLDPALRPGTLVIPSQVLSDGQALRANAGLAAQFGGMTDHTILAGAAPIADGTAKHRLHIATGAHAVDLESGAVAHIAQAYSLPFVVVRAICDPAERNLPPAALVALDPAGQIGLLSILRSLRQNPRQILGLLALARDAARARRTLFATIEHFRSRQRTETPHLAGP